MHAYCVEGLVDDLLAAASGRRKSQIEILLATQVLKRALEALILQLGSSGARTGRVGHLRA